MPSGFLGHFFRQAICRLFSWIIFEQGQQRDRGTRTKAISKIGERYDIKQKAAMR